MSVKIDSTSPPARRPLTRQRVLCAALAYADEHGLDALSMHKLGAALGVKGMSLYNHVPSKDGLLDGMVELMWSEVDVDVPAGGADWRESVRTLARALRSLVHRHPHAGPLLVSRQVMPAAALRVADAHLRVMRDGGVPESCAIPMLRSIFAYGFGYALAELSSFPSGTSGDADDDELRRLRRVTSLLPDDVPDHLVRLALLFYGDYDTDDQFDLGISLMIRGFDAYLVEAPPEADAPA